MLRSSRVALLGALPLRGLRRHAFVSPPAVLSMFCQWRFHSGSLTPTAKNQTGSPQSPSPARIRHGRAVLVLNVAPSIPLQKLFVFLETFGTVLAIRRQGKDPTRCVAVFATADAAMTAVRMCGNVPFFGTALRVKDFKAFSDPKPFLTTTDPRVATTTDHDFSNSRHRNRHQRRGADGDVAPSKHVVCVVDRAPSDDDAILPGINKLLEVRGLRPSVQTKEGLVVRMSFGTSADGVKALVELHGQEVAGGCPLHVSFAAGETSGNDAVGPRGDNEPQRLPFALAANVPAHVPLKHLWTLLETCAPVQGIRRLSSDPSTCMARFTSDEGVRLACQRLQRVPFYGGSLSVRPCPKVKKMFPFDPKTDPLSLSTVNHKFSKYKHRHSSEDVQTGASKVKPPSEAISIVRLSEEVGDHDLRIFLESRGVAPVAFNRAQGTVVHVTLDSTEAAVKALCQLHGETFSGRELHVEFGLSEQAP